MTRRPVIVDTGSLRALNTAKKALERAVDGTERLGGREVPKWLPNGAEAVTVAQVAVLMGTTDAIAARYVVEAKDPHPDLLLEAKDVVSGMPGIKPKRQRLGIVQRPHGRVRIRKRRRTGKGVPE